jgi:hypothetical protein
MKYTKAQREKLIDERAKVLLDYGFSGAEAETIMEAAINTNLLFHSSGSIRSKLANLGGYGFSKEEVRKIVLEAPAVLSFAEESVNSKLKNYEAYGFSKEEVRKLVLGSRSAVEYAEKSVNSKLRNLEAYGFSRAEVRKIVLGMPAVLDCAKKPVNSKLRNLEAYGFSRAEVRKIVLGVPAALGCAKKSVNSKLRNLEKTRTFHNGFAMTLDNRKVRKLILSFPSVLSFSEHTLGWKMRTMAVITEGEKQEMLEMGKHWMQSARKSVARAQYLKRNGKDNRYPKDVFLSAKRFERKYRVSL